MRSTVAHVVDVSPRKKQARAELKGEGVRKFLATVNLGAVVERAIALAGMSKDTAAREMAYASAASVSRWIANEEAPNWPRLWAVLPLRAGLVAALAEAAGESVEVETTVHVRRRIA